MMYLDALVLAKCPPSMHIWLTKLSRLFICVILCLGLSYFLDTYIALLFVVFCLLGISALLFVYVADSNLAHFQSVFEYIFLKDSQIMRIISFLMATNCPFHNTCTCS